MWAMAIPKIIMWLHKMNSNALSPETPQFPKHGPHVHKLAPPSHPLLHLSPPPPPPSIPSSTASPPPTSLTPSVMPHTPDNAPPPSSPSSTTFPPPSSPPSTTIPSAHSLSPPPSNVIITPPSANITASSPSPSPSPIPSSSAPPNPNSTHSPPAQKSPGTESPLLSSKPMFKPEKSHHGRTLSIGILGIIVAGLIVFALFGFLIRCIKKKRRTQQGDHYYGQPAGSFKSGALLLASQKLPSSDYSHSSGQTPTRLPPPPNFKNGYIDQNVFVGGASLGIPQHLSPLPGPGMGNSKSQYMYEELAIATNGFSQENLLGEGGFGFVYKGCLQDGQVVAVKQLKMDAKQGEREFQAEVEIIGRVHHRHLVSLLGYCIAANQRLLVYEYVPNGNLEYHLHGKGRPGMDWATRVKIAVGAARGLAYLHEDCHPRIIHRDIKSSNILLGNNYEAQVSDFGLAKLAPDTYTHMTTRVMGTLGYMAPEYAASGKLTEKSDVYSFGVVLLELVTGRKPIDIEKPESLLEWSRPLLNLVLDGGNLDCLADPRLQNSYDEDEMLCMIEVAAACVRHSAQRRPRMGQVVRALERNAHYSDLSNGMKPGHSAEYDNAQYSAFISRFRRMAFDNEDNDNEYSGDTSEYGLNASVSST